MRDGVVLLHALARRPGSMARLAEALAASGYETLAPAYPSRRKTIADIARGLAPAIAVFGARVDRLHFVGHSMGGLVARAVIAGSRPARLGAVVTLGTPHGGSEIVDLLQRSAAFRAFYGPAFAELSRAASADLNARLGPLDYPLGAIAGTRALNVVAGWFVLPRPNDGTVSVASAQPPGAWDRCLVACDHLSLPRDRRVMALACEFLTEGRFRSKA